MSTPVTAAELQAMVDQLWAGMKKVPNPSQMHTELYYTRRALLWALDPGKNNLPLVPDEHGNVEVGKLKAG